MPDVVPGDATYDDAIRRIAHLLESEERERGTIQHLSTESFREWLGEVVNRISRQFGITVGNALALIADIKTMGYNAAKSFGDGWREGYQKGRRIQRLR